MIGVSQAIVCDEIMKQLLNAIKPAKERPPAMERRLVLRVLNYWRHLAGEREFPSVEDIKTDDIPEIWPNCFILDPADTPDDPVLVEIGEYLEEEFGKDARGKRVSEVVTGTLLAAALGHYRQVAAKKVPISLGGDYINSDGVKVLYRSIILPLSGDGETIDKFFGAANSRSVSAS
jgi:hypothetical protein